MSVDLGDIGQRAKRLLPLGWWWMNECCWINFQTYTFGNEYSLEHFFYEQRKKIKISSNPLPRHLLLQTIGSFQCRHNNISPAVLYELIDKIARSALSPLRLVWSARQLFHGDLHSIFYIDRGVLWSGTSSLIQLQICLRWGLHQNNSMSLLISRQGLTAPPVGWTIKHQRPKKGLEMWIMWIIRGGGRQEKQASEAETNDTSYPPLAIPLLDRDIRLLLGSLLM